MTRTIWALVVVALVACGAESESEPIGTTTTAGSGTGAGGAGQGGGTTSSTGQGGAGGAGKAQACIDMVEDALAFLDALEMAEYDAATADYGGDRHTAFEFLPPMSAARDGVSIKDLDTEERDLLASFLQSAFSQSGYAKVEQIRALESVLAMQESGMPTTANRDPENYFIQVFGTPVVDGDLPWGFRFEGHHLSVQAAVIDCRLFSATPAFWGASPEVTPLSTETTAAESLWADLDAGQQGTAQVSVGTTAIDEKDGRLDPLTSEGLRYAEMTPAQQALLMQIIDAYLDNMNAPIAADRHAALEAAGRDDISFAYDGGDFRVLGPTFVIELVYAGNTHIHSVWRDYDGDYGDDLIARHMADFH